VNAPSSANYRFYDLAPELGSFLDDVLQGLSQAQKSLPAKYFYDEHGSVLFEKICELPEYYPTRTEIALMRQHAADMATQVGPKTLLIEYGSGSSTKTPILIDALQPACYVPIDISRELLTQSALALAQERPGFPVRAVCADYTQPFSLPPLSDIDFQRKLVYFPGSTIGNFDRAETDRFLRHVVQTVGINGGALIGVDLKKDRAKLHAAYNDATGITAEFNLNVLRRINRELNGNFDLAGFRHHAFYDEALGRIEMHLLSLRPQTVSVADRSFQFRESETIHTEISCKYGIEEFQAVARTAGLTASGVWTDADALFSVHYLTVPSGK
jgi:dimethylhistidine N-methyltransferase